MIKKLLLVISVAVLMIAALWISYPKASYIFERYNISYYHYRPKSEIVPIDTSNLPDPVAVPMLMYHGVIDGFDADNTNINRFIEHMEMLKREGYETITLQQLDLFFQGKYKLPKRPIIITFDDGRKDSYYTTDSVFEKLGFNATIFVVSGKSNDRDKFYLGWDTLRIMKQSGRWDIQAHGTYSHDHIPTGPNGEGGRFLTSRMYVKGKQETIEEYQQRVENDYVKNIKDIKANLGYYPKYFAIPLNEYGDRIQTNYEWAAEYNHEIIKKYFRLAFIEGYIYAPGDTYSRVYNRPIYNYQDTDPMRVSRLEPKNMGTEALRLILENNAPHTLPYKIDNTNIKDFETETALAYGKMEVGEDGLHLATEQGEESAKVYFGNLNWTNYEVEVKVERKTGRSVVLLAYSKNDESNLAFGVTDNGVFLRESLDGEEKELRNPYFFQNLDNNFDFKLVFIGNYVNAYLNGQLLYYNVKTDFEKGQVGLKVWSDESGAESVLKYISIM